MARWQWSVAAGLLWWPGLALAQSSSYFAGAVGGISTLSADGASVATPTSIAISQYKPENGAGVQAFGGYHLNDYVSLQGSYGWNRNSLQLTSSVPSDDSTTFYEQNRRATQHSLVGDLLLYVRNRKSFARPYLSVGFGVVHLDSDAGSIGGTLGTLPPPGPFSSTKPALRVAVGVDIFLKGSWAFRFTFIETIRNNPISAQLTPPGSRNLANFQNLFGFVKYF